VPSEFLKRLSIWILLAGFLIILDVETAIREDQETSADEQFWEAPILGCSETDPSWKDFILEKEKEAQPDE
jgi:hypothetical protein